MNKAQRQALHLQSLALKSAETLSADLQETKDKELRTKQAQALSAVIRAYDALEDRKRILSGKPMPGSLRPVAKPKKSKRTSQSPIELVEFKDSKESLLPGEPQKIEEGGGTTGGGV